MSNAQIDRNETKKKKTLKSLTILHTRQKQRRFANFRGGMKRGVKKKEKELGHGIEVDNIYIKKDAHWHAFLIHLFAICKAQNGSVTKR